MAEPNRFMLSSTHGTRPDGHSHVSEGNQRRQKSVLTVYDGPEKVVCSILKTIFNQVYALLESKKNVFLYQSLHAVSPHTLSSPFLTTA